MMLHVQGAAARLGPAGADQSAELHPPVQPVDRAHAGRHRRASHEHGDGAPDLARSIVAGAKAGVMDREFGITLITHVVVLNLTLLFFNLLPIPPLDGGAVLAWFLPRSMQGAIEFLNRWGFVILHRSHDDAAARLPDEAGTLPDRALARTFSWGPPLYEGARRPLGRRDGGWRRGSRRRRSGGRGLPDRAARVRGTARSAAAPLQDPRARHPEHPHRLRRREVRRVPRDHAGDVGGDRRRVPGDGGDPGLPQGARAGPRPRAAGGAGGGRRGGARPARGADPAAARVPEVQGRGRPDRRSAGGGAQRVPAGREARADQRSRASWPSIRSGS